MTKLSSFLVFFIWLKLFNAHSQQWVMDNEFVINDQFERMEALAVDTRAAMIYKYYLTTSQPSLIQKIKDILVKSTFKVTSTQIMYPEPQGTSFIITLSDTTSHTRETLLNRLRELKKIIAPLEIYKVQWSIEGINSTEIIPNIIEYEQTIKSIQDSTLFERGMQLRYYHYLEYAISAFKECLNRNYLPDSAVVLLVECYYTENQNEVIPTLKKGLEISPKSVRLLISMGEAYWYINHDLEQSVDWMFKVLQLSPENKFALMHIGRVYFEIENFGKSKIYLEKLLDLDPANSSGVYYLGKIKEKGL